VERAIVHEPSHANRAIRLDVTEVAIFDNHVAA
jgi:hypothetical protein